MYLVKFCQNFDSKMDISRICNLLKDDRHSDGQTVPTDDGQTTSKMRELIYESYFGFRVKNDTRFPFFVSESDLKTDF